MSNRKQSKKESPVYLGFPDGAIEQDNDAYVTKLGGLPVWLDNSKPPSSKVCHCRICKEPMYLVFQSYAPLPESPYHRVIYVWACNKRSCMRKEGSFSVVRSHLVDQKYLKAQRQKEEEKRKKEEKRKAAEEAAKKQAFGNGFQLGDLWGNSAGSFGKSNATGGFGMPSNTTGGFGMSSNTTGGFGMTKPTAASIVASGTKKDTKPEEQLIEQMQQLVIKDPIDSNILPQFPGEYLYIDEERTDDYAALGIDMSRYKEYLDMEKEMLMDVDENGEIWQGEAYEKQQLPKGVDKQFKKFSERVEFAPAQCVRYDYNGQPLFYSALRPQDQQLISSPCKYCGGPRVFELQLMPNILSILPVTEYASKNESPTTQQSKTTDPKSLLDSWSVGMEFGSVFVFVCQKDCHQGSIDDVAYMEETVLVQYETD